MNENNQSDLRISVNGEGSVLNLGYVEFFDDMTENYNSEKINSPDMGVTKGVTYDFYM